MWEKKKLIEWQEGLPFETEYPKNYSIKLNKQSEHI